MSKATGTIAYLLCCLLKPKIGNKSILYCPRSILNEKRYKIRYTLMELQKWNLDLDPCIGNQEDEPQQQTVWHRWLSRLRFRKQDPAKTSIQDCTIQDWLNPPFRNEMFSEPQSRIGVIRDWSLILIQLSEYHPYRCWSWSQKIQMPRAGAWKEFTLHKSG